MHEGVFQTRRIGSRAGTALDLSDELELTHLKLADRAPEDIALEPGEHEQQAFTGTGQGPLTEEEQVLLSEVVDAINERFGSEVTDDDKIFYQAVGEGCRRIRPCSNRRSPTTWTRSGTRSTRRL